MDNLLYRKTKPETDSPEIPNPYANISDGISNEGFENDKPDYQTVM